MFDDISKELFPNIFNKEYYSLFELQCLDILKNGDSIEDETHSVLLKKENNKLMIATNPNKNWIGLDDLKFKINNEKWYKFNSDELRTEINKNKNKKYKIRYTNEYYLNFDNKIFNSFGEIVEFLLSTFSINEILQLSDNLEVCIF